MKKLVVLFSGLLLAVACGDDSPKNSTGGGNNQTPMLVKPGTTEACGLAGRSGETECINAALTCQAGQYCNQEEITCSVGCTSDNNCAANQFCDLTEGSPGTCLNCVTFTPQPSNNTPSNNTPSNNTPTNNPPTGVTAACETIVNAGVTCELIASGEAAAFKTACTTEGTSAEINLLLTCVNSAGSDCEQVAGCLGDGDDGTCETDFECDDTPGQFHEICSGGFCLVGCRDSSQCGQDFVCDLDLGPGTAGACVPDF